jgi:hypothetical protein
MTAPLPPLPAPTHRFAIEITPNGERLDYSARDMRDFAKLAVREALLKVAAAVSVQQDNGGDCVMSIRAMLKEYE